ncbi:hypothetical protein MKX01_038679, partial [Papaver californicum]
MMMKKMMLKSVLVACITLLLLAVLTQVTDAARTSPHGPTTLVTGSTASATGSKAVATDSVAYPQ